jgi:hypothetical protein
MEALENLVVLCLAATVGAASGIVAGCKIHLRRVRENQKYLDGQVGVAVRYQWADRLWLRLFILAAAVVIVIMGWQFPFCESLGLFMLTLVVSYWVTRARRAYNNLAGFD